MNQYHLIKKQNQDCLVFFRIGEFYELFYEDAKIASSILQITLTKRLQKNEVIPMSGMPACSAEAHISKLVKSGYKIAVCEQVSKTESSQQEIIQREVVRIITPGTLIETTMLDSKKNNFLISFVAQEKMTACIFDLSTNEIYIEDINSLKEFLEKTEPSEILVDKQHISRFQETEHSNLITFIIQNSLDIYIEKILKYYDLYCKDSISYLSDVHKLALGIIIEYIEKTQKKLIYKLSLPEIIDNTKNMLLDKYTRRNLEITKTLQGNSKGSIFWFLNQTKTAQGSRMLFQILNNPTFDEKILSYRYSCIENFQKNNKNLEIIDQLSHIVDFERVLTRVFYNKFFAYDILSIANSIKHLEQICKILKYKIEIDHVLINNIISAISPEINLKTNYIQNGYSEKIDQLRLFKSETEKRILRLEKYYQKEASDTILIKLINNEYLIEADNKDSNNLTYKFELYKKLKNTSYYITAEIEEINHNLANCENMILAEEKNILDDFVSQILKINHQIKIYGKLSAEIDLFANLAFVSSENNFTKPIINNAILYESKEAFHPILNALQKHFVKNDCNLNDGIIFLSAPNMSGKSTFLRQQALLVLFAQIGMYVPASYFQFKLVDKLFCRIGTDDNLIEGKSTFMNEMIETALAINQATSESFLIFDEVGRGTNAKEGEAIAQAVLEYILSMKIRCIFASHFLNLRFIEHDFLKKYTIQIIENPLQFTYKIIKGTIDYSFAITIAKIAGLKNEIIERAKDILNK